MRTDDVKRSKTAAADEIVGTPPGPSEFMGPTALIWAGIGIMIANKLRDWFPDSRTWIALAGIVLVLGGGALWHRYWKRIRKQNTT